MDSNDITMMSVSDLDFDLENPRLAEHDVTRSDVIQILWETMDVRELVLSIAASGFFWHEPLIVVRERDKNVVIEGNRRLAAVKVLLDPSLVVTPEQNIPNISREAKRDLTHLPIIIGTRKQAWRYIGFKHVNGPAKWSSYAKSQYIAKVHREYDVKLEDIASQIGDTHKTVQRLFRGMMVIKQAECMNVFDRMDRWRGHFAFSHLYTGLGYSGISTFIGLRPGSEEEMVPVPIEKKEQLRELFLWLYGSKKEEIRPVIQSQNPDLRKLDTIVSNREAISALRASSDLAYAFEISRPSSNVFEESLLAAKRDLEKARSLVSTGYDHSRHLLTIAEEVARIAEDLWEDMDRMLDRRKKRRRKENS